jgi:hypoxanthine phosphoribosyltransferase
MESSGMEQKRKRKIGAEIEYLRNAIELRPKSLNWKVRAKVGDKVRWYELPEEVDYIVPQPQSTAGLSIEDNGKEYRWLGFGDMESIAHNMANSIKSEYGKPRAILYIERGGMVLAKMLSDMLGVKEMYGVQIVAYESVNRQGQGMYILPHYISLDMKKGEYLLLVDDIADSGKTLKAASDLFSKKYGRLVVATMAYKKRSVFKPDVIGKTVPDNAWIVFGYEENESATDFKKENISKGIELINRANGLEKGSFDQMKSRAKKIAKSILEKHGAPAAILYISHSDLVAARLLSDFLSVKRVSSIIPNMYIEGDYSQHVANVCAKALDGKPSSYILLADMSGKLDSEIANKLKGIRMVTVSLEDMEIKELGAKRR